jgi:hypothetical protein
MASQGTAPPRGAAADAAAAPGERRWALAIHGGAGVINSDNEEWIRETKEGIAEALQVGVKVGVYGRRLKTDGRLMPAALTGTHTGLSSAAHPHA